MRAIASLGIVAFSYVLTLAVAVCCAALPFVVWAYGFSGAWAILLSAMAVVLAVSLFWSLIPRRTPFHINGVELDLNTQPRLKALIDSIAEALGEQSPTAVFLIPDPNAFVTEIGRKKRVMALGLPLLAMLRVSEFRGVLAHEFAHYYSGDTRLAPIVQRAQSTMVRTIKNLGSGNEIVEFLGRFGAAALLYHAVVWCLVIYWKLFLRIVQHFARQQEYRSDELACYVAGSTAVAAGLERVATAMPIWSTFCNRCVAPILQTGFCPPLADGLKRFVAGGDAQGMLAQARESLLVSSKADPYSTHPPMKLRMERVAQLQIRPAEWPEEERELAVSLIDDLDVLEERLLKVMVPTLTSELKPMRWDTVGTDVWIPAWREAIGKSAMLKDRDPADLPEFVRDLANLARLIPDPPGVLLTREQRIDRAAGLLSQWIAVSLIDRGWTLRAEPGTVFLELDSKRLDPANYVWRFGQAR